MRVHQLTPRLAVLLLTLGIESAAPFDAIFSACGTFSLSKPVKKHGHSVTPGESPWRMSVNTDSSGSVIKPTQS